MPRLREREPERSNRGKGTAEGLLMVASALTFLGTVVFDVAAICSNPDLGYWLGPNFPWIGAAKIVGGSVIGFGLSALLGKMSDNFHTETHVPADDPPTWM